MFYIFTPTRAQGSPLARLFGKPPAPVFPRRDCAAIAELAQTSPSTTLLAETENPLGEEQAPTSPWTHQTLRETIGVTP